MKTSINIPDLLVEEVQELDMAVPLGAFVRDALLIALPAWRKAVAEHEAVLRAEMRIRESEWLVRTRDGKPVRRQSRNGMGSRPRVQQGRAPAKTLAEHRSAAEGSEPKAEADSRPARSTRKRAAPSSRKKAPTDDSSD